MFGNMNQWKNKQKPVRIQSSVLPFSPYSTKKISMAGNLYLGAVLSSLVKGH
jgi:hypothetical protein